MANINNFGVYSMQIRRTNGISRKANSRVTRNRTESWRNGSATSMSIYVEKNCYISVDTKNKNCEKVQDGQNWLKDAEIASLASRASKRNQSTQKY